ncbi:hypothetical protein [Chitinophaga sp. Cy-1792]|uniref:hypothetical protein n=1 Tax=Chitinophaga sp. Cy-1792 TaxID=2608339 RepID=UPI001422C4FD|nr:hypothetical protein [Chitinophaga sp. Cy-1792]NIG54965.1 hypothetical protein [Chitinophaga sp. Cy-1792]
MTYDALWWALLAGSIGISVGLSELLNRYRTFHYILVNRFSYVYMLINFLGAVMAYVIIKVYHLNLGPINQHELGLSLVAGFGAMIFLRSSFFSYKDGKNKIVEVGPSIILSVFLKTAERQFDQILSKEYIRKICVVLNELEDQLDAENCVFITNHAMHVLSKDEKEDLVFAVRKIMNDGFKSERAKTIAVGLIIIQHTGIDLFIEILNALKLEATKFTVVTETL